MSTPTITQIFGPGDAQRIAEAAAAHQPATGGWLLEIDNTDNGYRFGAIAAQGGSIAVARQVPEVGWLVIPLMVGAPKTAVRCDTEADALEWLEYIANLHTAVSA